jgi:hypothetical protein
MLEVILVAGHRPIQVLNRNSHHKKALRALIDARLVKVVALGPARYRLTPQGERARMAAVQSARLRADYASNTSSAAPAAAK